VLVPALIADLATIAAGVMPPVACTELASTRIGNGLKLLMRGRINIDLNIIRVREGSYCFAMSSPERNDRVDAFPQ
jgi:hypothetical protein